MSLIDSRRPPSASGRLQKLFSNAQSKNGRQRTGSTSPYPSQAIPGLGRELSISEISQVDGRSGRYLRIFCEHVCPSAQFKTVFVQQDDSVGQCVDKVVEQLTKEGEPVFINCTLFEAIGQLPPHSRAINDSGSVNDPGETFTELTSRPLSLNEKLMSVFSLMVPAPGLCRRIELRKQSSPSPITILNRGQSLENSRHRSPRLPYAPVVAPYCPFLLLIKGCKPESDLVVHNFSNICRGNLADVTMGTSENDDIRLYPSPEARGVREHVLANGNGYTLSKSPIRFSAKNMSSNSKTKAIWMSVMSTFNAVQPDAPLSVILNYENLTETSNLPVNRCLEPGDILQVGAQNLIYVFLFKDSNIVPDYKLPVGLLTPSTPNSGAKPPTGQNGSRSAARTARIDAQFRKTSSNGTISCHNALPSLSNVDIVVGTLFPRVSSRGKDLNWSEMGGTLPDVSVAAGCFAHLLRSVVRYDMESGLQATEDDVFREIHHALSLELDKLNKLASTHLIPAMWEAAFCYYLAQYLSPGWLKSMVGGGGGNGSGTVLPRICVTERRRSVRMRSVDRNSPATADSASDVFLPSPDRPRQLLPSGFAAEAYSPDFENAPVLASLRERVASEADSVINQAVQLLLNASSKEIVKLCRAMGTHSGEDDSRALRDAQLALSDKLDSTGDAISQALTTRNQIDLTANNGGNSSVGGIRLSQAQPYNGRDARKALTLNPVGVVGKAIDDSSEASSLHRNSSSVIDSEVEEGDRTSASPTSSIQIDDEMHSTPGEEDDTGFGSSTTGGSTKGAQQRVENVFFCRFLLGISKRVLVEFINNRDLVLNKETGVKVTDLVKILRRWMRNAGVQRYNEALLLLSDFAGLLSTSRRELGAMTWEQLCAARPNLPRPLLHFIMQNYDINRSKSDSYDLISNSSGSSDGDPINAINEYTSPWQEMEHIYIPPQASGSEVAYLPSDLATLFSSVRAKMSLDSFDSSLAKRHQTFRWSGLLKSFKPPGLLPKDRSGHRSNGCQLSHQLPDLIRGKQHGSSDYSEIQDLSDPRLETRTSRPSIFDALEIAQPKQSMEGPSLSVLAGRPHNYRRATASELGGTRRTMASELGGVSRNDVQKVYPVPGGGFRSRNGVYNIGASSPHLQDIHLMSGTMSVSRARNFNRRSNNPRGFGSSASNLGVSQSIDARLSSQDVRKIRDDWSEFKRNFSRPETPSTIEPDVETLNGSISVPPNLMTQSAHNFGSSYSIRRRDSLSSFMDLGLRKSQQSLISVDIDRQTAPRLMNVLLEKVSTETYGLKFVEGHTTRFGQLGIYVKSITDDTAAARANIEVGDRVIAINGKDVTGMTFKETCDLLKENTARVTLTIQRGLVDNPEDLMPF